MNKNNTLWRLDDNKNYKKLISSEYDNGNVKKVYEVGCIEKALFELEGEFDNDLKLVEKFEVNGYEYTKYVEDDNANYKMEIITVINKSFTAIEKKTVWVEGNEDEELIKWIVK